MVGFHEHIISDLLEDPNGGLVVMSSGLSLHILISSLLQLHSPSQGTLLILSASPSQKSTILRSLSQSQSPNPTNPTNPNPNSTIPSELSFDLPSNHRQSLYSTGSIFFITPRILIVDLLTSKLPTSSIAGLLILNAHTLSDTSTEAFAVRILRSLRSPAYIRAFSDRPHAMISAFAKAERIMKCLFIRRLHLWPRFHVLVSEQLERTPPEVVDVRVPLSPLMKGIQKAVVGAMDACLKELRKTNKVDVDDLTVENGLFKSFDEIVRRQLDPIWHTIGKKTKQLVSDLQTLRKLLDYLVRYDAVTYLKYLDTLRVSEGVRSVWIFADSSHRIFEYAKKRVFQLVTSEGGKVAVDSKNAPSKKRKVKEGGASSSGKDDVKTDASSGVVLQEVLEESPKWKVLREILEEIGDERQKSAPSSEGEFTVEDAGDDSGIVLVACKDERTCMQLEDCIMMGPQKVMQKEWEKYLLGKAELYGLRTRAKKKSKDPKGFGILNGLVPAVPREYTEATSNFKVERDALMAAASEINYLTKEEVDAGDNFQPLPGRGRGKGRLRGRGRRRSQRGKAVEEVKVSKTVVPKKVASDISGLESRCQRAGIDPIDTADLQEHLRTSSDENILRKHTEEFNNSELKRAKQLPPVHFYVLDSDQHILDVMKPSAIVVYHPDMAFVREIEIYKANNPLKKLKVYFLFYEDSTEVQKFEASIRRENGAFESLIRQKSLMMIPVDQDGRCLGLDASNESLISQNSITRKAGGRKAAEREMQVIVDIREFMSSLPNVLHQKGMRIIPVTLEVGDYVLSPLICVERKSISDLFSSFASGRLYNQVETMARYYRVPVLLIEFSQDKSFSFQSASDIGDDVVPTSIISKLSLLVLHFPRLRLVWSRSLHATAEIFASLKANQDEPDESRAMRVGVPTEEGIVENDVRAENYNTSAVEFLRRLPGVTDSNYRGLMDGCKSLSELALLPVERLAELMGGQKAAKTLRDFLDAKCPSML